MVSQRKNETHEEFLIRQRAARKDWIKTPKGKVSTKVSHDAAEIYRKTPEGRAKRNKAGSDFAKTDKGKLYFAKKQARRKRELGYIIISPISEGEVGHHIDNEHVIGIPERAHQSCSHKSRPEHRRRVLNWLEKNNKTLYLICKDFEENIWN